MSNSTSEVAYTLAKSGAKKGRSFFMLRCGVALIAFLALCVTATIFKQLRELSKLFNEISQGGHTTYNQEGAKRWTKHIDVYGPVYNAHFDKKVIDHFAKNRTNKSEFRPANTGFSRSFGTRFQEKVYTVRRSFYESLQGTTNGQNKFYETAQDSKTDEGGSIHGFQTIRPSGSQSNDLVKTGASDPGVSRFTRSSVMIFAYHRSGSSFIGEMFNRNPEVFYLFEPVHPIQMFFGTRRRFPLLYDTLIRQLLDTIYKCSFDKYPFFVNILSTSSFRLKSQVLSSPNLCDPRVTSRKMHLCQRINATLLMRICRSSFHTVIKTIRMSNWENLEFLTKSELSGPTGSLSFKLIHLVRDPRAIVTSRVWWFLRNFSEIMKENATVYDVNVTAKRHAIAGYIRNMSVNLCRQMYKDIMNGNKKTADGTIYAMVRFEDAAKRPLKAYEKIYEFAGITESKHVRQWLERNTKSNADPGYYSTTRKSSAAANMWRLRLPMTLVAEVQNECSEVLRILGYKLVYSDEELRNISKSLVIEWRDGGLLRSNQALRK